MIVQMDVPDIGLDVAILQNHDGLFHHVRYFRKLKPVWENSRKRRIDYGVCDGKTSTRVCLTLGSEVLKLHALHTEE